MKTEESPKLSGDEDNSPIDIDEAMRSEESDTVGSLLDDEIDTKKRGGGPKSNSSGGGGGAHGIEVEESKLLPSAATANPIIHITNPQLK